MPSRCCFILTSLTLFVTILAGVISYLVLSDSDEPNGIASCGGCHCIVDGTTGSCPTERPRLGSEYDRAVIDALRRQVALNPYQLKCDPYDEEGCTLDPPQDDTIDLGESAVCGLLYEFPAPYDGEFPMKDGVQGSAVVPEETAGSGVGEIYEVGVGEIYEGGGVGEFFEVELDGEFFEAETYQQSAEATAPVPTATSASTTTAPTNNDAALCPEAPLQYTMVSYGSSEAALADGAYITHTGSCGACSTTQDLAVYLQIPDLTTAAKFCVKHGLLNRDNGVSCFQNMGFTEPCAQIWMASGENTGQRCTLPCAAAEIQDYLHNGPAPQCDLNGCLDCDEKYSGPIFKQMAGRTRRRSGILSTIARSCEEMVFIDHNYACPSLAGEIIEESETAVAVAAAAKSSSP